MASQYGLYRVISHGCHYSASIFDLNLLLFSLVWKISKTVFSKRVPYSSHKFRPLSYWHAAEPFRRETMTCLNFPVWDSLLTCQCTCAGDTRFSGRLWRVWRMWCQLLSCRKSLLMLFLSICYKVCTRWCKVRLSYAVVVLFLSFCCATIT